MEFRWLTKEEQRTRVVESSSLSDVLALAQKLQADDERLVSEEQVVEMGRELGVRPEHVREALRLHRGAAQPTSSLRTPPAVPAEPNPVTRVAQAGLVGLGLGTLPLALAALAQSSSEPLAVCAFAAAFAAGWAARSPRLAGIAGSLVIPPWSSRWRSTSARSRCRASEGKRSCSLCCRSAPWAPPSGALPPVLAAGSIGSPTGSGCPHPASIPEGRPGSTTPDPARFRSKRSHKAARLPLTARRNR